MTHGSITTYNHGCRCDACRRANRLKKQQWEIRTSFGSRPVFVDAEPVLAHLEALKASGWTFRDIGREIGRKPEAINHLRVAPRRGRRRIRVETAAAILALQPLAPVALDTVVVDRLIYTPVDGYWKQIGATREERIAAAELADRAGVPRNHIERRYGLRAGRDFAVRQEQAS